MGRPRTCECGVCEKCKHRERERARYQAMTIEERRARTRNRETHKRSSRQWREQNPEKNAAHQKLRTEVRSGRVSPKSCEMCGSTSHIHGHHADYSKPLEVQWLCPQHHADVHHAA